MHPGCFGTGDFVTITTHMCMTTWWQNSNLEVMSVMSVKTQTVHLEISNVSAETDTMCVCVRNDEKDRPVRRIVCMSLESYRNYKHLCPGGSRSEWQALICVCVCMCVYKGYKAVFGGRPGFTLYLDALKQAGMRSAAPRAQSIWFLPSGDTQRGWTHTDLISLCFVAVIMQCIKNRSKRMDARTKVT